MWNSCTSVSQKLSHGNSMNETKQRHRRQAEMRENKKKPCGYERRKSERPSYIGHATLCITTPRSSRRIKPYIYRLTLAKKLLDGNVPLHIVKLFIFWYREQEFMVRFGTINRCSVHIGSGNGASTLPRYGHRTLIFIQNHPPSPVMAIGNEELNATVFSCTLANGNSKNEIKTKTLGKNVRRRDTKWKEVQRARKKRIDGLTVARASFPRCKEWWIT